MPSMPQALVALCGDRKLQRTRRDVEERMSRQKDNNEVLQSIRTYIRDIRCKSDLP
jgi:hypothetical protein